MRRWIKYRKELRELQKEVENLTAPYDKLYKKSVKAGDEDAWLVYEPIDFDLDVLGYEIEQLHTNYYIDVARRYNIPFPRPHLQHEYWTIETPNGPFILTSEGKYTIRKLIDEARSRKRQPIFAWISLVTGLLAAATGLIAVLSK